MKQKILLMSSAEQASETARFTIRNIGGISQTTVNIDPGVSILAGRNATNRTSLLQAIMAAMGSDQATLKGDADEGHVKLEFRGETYERTLTRKNGTIQMSGTGYLNEVEVAELFAFLLESNEARQAVARSADLRDLIMRPIDTDAITSEIERLQAEKAEINDELATIESRKAELPDLEQRRASLETEIEEHREKLAALEEQIDASDQDIEQRRTEEEALDAKLEELRSTRSELESVRDEIETQETSIESLQREAADLEAELSDLAADPLAGHGSLDEEIETLRRRRQSLKSEIADLQQLIEYNQDQLEDAGGLLDSQTESAANSESVTDQLLADDSGEVVCWTCGTTVDRDQIEETIERLQAVREQKMDALEATKADLQERKERKQEAQTVRKRRAELEDKLETIEEERTQRRERLSTLKTRRGELTETIQTLEQEVNELESDGFEEILSVHKEANQIEFELEQLETDLEEVQDTIATIESRIDEAERLRARREELVDEIHDLRTRVEQIEQQAVEAFNDHMETIRERLNYDNLERIWIERVHRTDQGGQQTVEGRSFELHVVRNTRSGAAYEDTVDHLSESEREVTGLVFALAGYLVHDLYETVPFMLLDSLEAIDATRIAALVEHFADYADYLVIALLEEDAEHLREDQHSIITDI